MVRHIIWGEDREYGYKIGMELDYAMGIVIICCDTRFFPALVRHIFAGDSEGYRGELWTVGYTRHRQLYRLFNRDIVSFPIDLAVSRPQAYHESDDVLIARIDFDRLGI